MTKTVRDMIAGATLLALSIGAWWVATGITSKMKTGVDSGYFPERAAILLGALSAMILIRAVLRRESGVAEEADARSDQRNVLAVFATFVVYAVVLPQVGFIVSTVIFFVVMMTLLAPDSGRNWLAFLVVATLMTLAIHTAFTRGFGVVLPSGPF
ncbi:tripartite tricarboxylate transporter TctB family protein [Puniceibacterium confluentis]|uniref:tripartite tricarboxylate transporter TctB family protein n=1 Tax=Puniceibacterium confluentis TaxID=1958944 RepID=UPI0011B589BD|nr:tripartite tricarboxylate transporter TctB family protein [Puniceibacterium confluentis]